MTGARDPGGDAGGQLVASLALREELGGFITHEARLLDERRYEEWAALFADDGVYWVPAAPDQTSPHDHVSLFYDDKATIQGRIARLRHPEIHVQTPASRVCHLISNLAVEANAEAGRYVVASNLLMVEYRPGSDPRMFAGRCQHVLRRKEGGLEIVLKRVDLVNCDAAFEALAVPI
jgi:benzoate/toluate 1,2-dioxygenase beta subunit